jgi:hypothetical protein
MRFLVSTACIALALGCGKAVLVPSEFGAREAKFVPDAAATLERRSYSGFTEPAQLVIGDVTAWTSAWDRLHATHTPQPGLPPVDFETQRVVLVALGTRANGGYSIEIDSIVTFQEGSAVFVTATQPGSNCFTTQALTQPVHAVLVAPIPPQPVTFQHRTVTQNCS